MRNKSSGELLFPVPSPSTGQPQPPPSCLYLLPLPPSPAFLPQLGMGSLGVPSLLSLSSHSPHSYGADGEGGAVLS